MKRIAIMRQKKIILNDFIKANKKEMLEEQQKAQRRVEMLPNIKMIEVQTQRDEENILAMVEAKEVH